jgi:HD-GYP domain-containing protein (c-di-GMP phosphodiesterase class II)
MFGSRPEQMAGIARALAAPRRAPLARGTQVVRRLPRTLRTHSRHLAAVCEVGRMLSDRLGLPATVQALFADFTERWDGKGEPGRIGGEQLPLALRIVHVARDGDFQATLGGPPLAARVLRERAGHAFDPVIAMRLADRATELLGRDLQQETWGAVLAAEPAPWLRLEGGQIDRALAAMGDFADLASPYLVGHSAGVATLAATAASHCRLDRAHVIRASLVHDVGRAAIPARVWQKPAPLSSGEWERVRLHAYHSERILARSEALARLSPVATRHHERLDGSGYHRGVTASALTPAARVLAAADAYHAMTEPRPHRTALTPERAAQVLSRDAASGALDADAVTGVLAAAGQPAPPIGRPAGLTDREAEVIGLLARGLMTKQIARTLDISPKTADHHVQNAYAKIGVSTRAAAALYAMEHGLAAWGELPIAHPSRRP